MRPLRAGDRVKRSDITATSIPAYRDMRGTIVAVRESGDVWVCWDWDGIPEAHARGPDTVALADD